MVKSKEIKITHFTTTTTLLSLPLLTFISLMLLSSHTFSCITWALCTGCSPSGYDSQSMESPWIAGSPRTSPQAVFPSGHIHFFHCDPVHGLLESTCFTLVSPWAVRDSLFRCLKPLLPPPVLPWVLQDHFTPCSPQSSFLCAVCPPQAVPQHYRESNGP